MSLSQAEGGPAEAKRRRVVQGTTALKPWGSIAGNMKNNQKILLLLTALWLVSGAIFNHVFAEEAQDNLLKSNIQKLAPDPNTIGLQYMKEKKYQEAVEVYKKAIAEGWFDVSYYINLAGAYKYLNETKKVPETYQQGIDAFSRHQKLTLEDMTIQISILYQVLAEYLTIRGEKDKALAVLNNAQKLKMKDPFYYSKIGWIYYGLGDKVAAKRSFDEALEKARSQNFQSAIEKIEGDRRKILE